MDLWLDDAETTWQAAIRRLREEGRPIDLEHLRAAGYSEQDAMDVLDALESEGE